MESKYFVPDISEMHVGCEFEMNDTWGGWIKLTLTEELLKSPLVGLGSGNERAPWYHNFRVPYLTIEQIEAEGWKEEFVYPEGSVIMMLGSKSKGYEFLYPKLGRQTVVTRLWEFLEGEYKRDVIFKGQCKSINEFRKICKLLGI